MLFYRLQGTAANIIRGAFYLFLGLLAMSVGQTLDTLRGPGKFILGDFVVTRMEPFVDDGDVSGGFAACGELGVPGSDGVVAPA
jgi:hypothetical protein